MTIAITGGKVHTITGGVINKGTVLIEDGKITAVGDDLQVPNDAKKIDATGKWVLPGLIDAHAHLGLFTEPYTWAHSDGNEATNPVTAGVRGYDSFYADDPAFADTVAAGITSVYTTVGSANVIGGTGLYVKLAGEFVEEMHRYGIEHMKMALGENPKRVYGENQKKMPSTRAGVAAVAREALIKAQNYLEKMEKAGDDEDGPERDFAMEQLVHVLKQEMRVWLHCHRVDDIRTGVRLAEEFGFKAVLQHVTEGYKTAEFLAERDVPCVVGPNLIPRAKMELRNITTRNAGLLARAGVKVSITQDASSGTQFLPVAAGVLVRDGMPEDEAFKGVTIYPAGMIGVEQHTGSLEAGKDADIAIFDGHPFDSMTHCDLTMIDGQVVYERS